MPFTAEETAERLMRQAALAETAQQVFTELVMDPRLKEWSVEWIHDSIILRPKGDKVCAQLSPKSSP